MSDSQLNVALYGIGLEAYWPQFAGLKERLEGYLREAAHHVEKCGASIVSLNLVGTPQMSREAGDRCRATNADLLIIYITTYALSNTVLPMVQRAGIPVLLLNLQPTAAIDYAAFNQLPDRTAMTGEWLAYCSACPVPEITNVLTRADIPFHQIIGILNDTATWHEVSEWIAAARVKKLLTNNRLGLLGHYYSGMLDIVTDLTQVSITFGTHIEHLEVDELSALRSEVTEVEIERCIATFHNDFDIQPDCTAEELARAARTSIALDRFVGKHDLHSLAYYYKGSGIPANEDTMSSIILGTSLLTARGIPVAGEYEVKNALAMKIIDSFGAGGSFTEYYAIDFVRDHVLMGHDGPGHIAIAETKTKVRPLTVYHGKVGRGLSVEMSVKHGPVTLLSVAEDRTHGFKFVIAQGQSVPGQTLHIGNTNSHYAFPIGAKSFVESWNEQGPAHHCAVGIGHIAGKLSKLARLLQIPFVQIC
ncbi:arabinose isomerase [Acidicapsa dinghuensis]|uniref:Arabinose isomerase n=1 Tax=Acidicapsa dinghuensis TaxID=2218256 RepID=A0ABW1EG89_9BACT|nr:arabinose isomerase [Acidicapsa dinghuensis]